jgi:hypothetical protein
VRVIDALFLDQIDSLVRAREDLARPFGQNADGWAAGPLLNALPPLTGHVRAAKVLRQRDFDLGPNPPAARS